MDGCKQKTIPNIGTEETSSRQKELLLSELKLTRNLKRGREIHAQAAETATYSCIYITTALIKMYAKCGSMADARQVFDSIKQPDVVSWTALISGYAENGEGIIALDTLARMKCQGFVPNSITFVAAIKACTSLLLDQDGRAGCLERGKQIHSEIGSHSNIYVQTTLIDMYGKFGSMVDAHQVFDSIKHPNVVTWNALISGYASNGEGLTALDLFARMKSQGCPPNSATFIAALKACTSLAVEQDGSRKAEGLERGRRIHSEISFHWTINLRNTLIDMYAKCQSMVEARQVFDSIKNPDVVTWNTLILGYAINGEGVSALDLFARMTSQGFQPNSRTFVAALKACISILEQDGGRSECRERGNKIQSEVGCHMNIYVQNTLIDLYAKCGSMSQARRVFDSMKHPDMVSWNALIMGYVENGECVIALDLFASMRSQGYVPDYVNLVAALKASAVLGALESGRKFHVEMGPKIDCNETLVTSLVDFYAKCGSMSEAQEVFDAHPRTRNLISFNALLSGYSRLGHNKVVFELFEGMNDAGLQPDGITFLCILTCCCHGGLVESAIHLFEAMYTNYAITPTIGHYTCMVDIFGRSNKLDDAIALLSNMRCGPNAVTWMTVLCAGHKWKNVGIGRLAFQSVVSLDKCNGAAYVLMAHIYGSKGMWNEQEIILGMRCQ